MNRSRSKKVESKRCNTKDDVNNKNTNLKNDMKNKKNTNDATNTSQNSSSNLDDSSPGKVNQNTKQKIINKKLKVKRKSNEKKKRGRPLKSDATSSDVDGIETNVGNVEVVLKDLERKFISDKNEKNIINETLRSHEENICIEVEDILRVQRGKGDNKTKKTKPCDTQIKEETDVDDVNLLEDYKKNIIEEMEQDNLLISTTEQECSPKQSTPHSSLSDCTQLSVTMQTCSSDMNANVHIESHGTHLEVSIDNQCVMSEKKKRKIITSGDEVATEAINEGYYSTQDESVDDSVVEKDPTENELEDQNTSMKRKRGNRKYRKKKNKDLTLEDDSDKVETGCEQIINPASSLEKDLVVLDIGVTDDANLAEQIRYIPVNLHKDFHGILLLSKHQVVAMKGLMQLTVVYGEVDITGYKMVAKEALLPYIDVFSVATSSLFYIRDLTPTPCPVEFHEKLLSILATTFQSTSNEMSELLGDIHEVYACVVVKKLYSMLPALFEKLNNVRGIPREPKFLPQPFYTAVLETDHWAELLNEIQTDMTGKKNDCICSIMFCGVKDVGKSSLARYSINRLLETHNAVFCLDCDCGQSEFTPPSVLSLVKVTKPLLGPPFSHQTMPVSAYFYGHISSGETPSEYIKLIGNLFQTYYTEYSTQGPLVINTQGWMQGLGLSLLVDIIRLTSPCHIVHIRGFNEKNNVPKELNDGVLENDGWHTNSLHKCMKNGHGCKYHNLYVADSQMSFKAGRNKSRVSRDQCLTSYFSELYQPYFDEAMMNGHRNEWIPPSMSVIKPYIVRWQDVALHIMHEKVTPDVMLFGFNLALVGLAHVDPELIQARKEDSEHPNYLLNQPVAEYIGFGIVRNIDENRKLFFILTAEPVEKLKNVNALLRGSAQLPTSYFLEDTHSNQPYYCSDYITVASKTASGMKPRYNLKRKPSKMRTAGVE